MAENEAASPSQLSKGQKRFYLSLVVLFLPGILFGLGLLLVRNHPRFAWLSSTADYPVEFWIIFVSGVLASTAGFLDWNYHRSGRTVIGRPEHQSELVALAAGGLPLFLLMATASILPKPSLLLLPILIVVLFTTVMICYDEFVFHRKRLSNLRNHVASSAGVWQWDCVVSMDELVLCSAGLAWLKQHEREIC